MIKDLNGSLQGLIVSAVNILREPAGKKYPSMEDIRRDRDQFVKDFHAGLFFLHVMTINAIICAEEEKMRSPKSATYQETKASRRGRSRILQLFRCINDAIVWIALQPEPSLFIRRTCRKQPRGKLREQNYESVMEAMQHLFGGGKVLPIWNDATRCIDISDITLLSPLGISFLELKTGKVNEQIIGMMGKTNRDEVLTELDTFFEKYGKKGMEQIDRIVRQTDRANKLVELSKHDNVIDPFLDMKRIAVTPDRLLNTYDTELSPLFKELCSRDFVAHSIDGCLHVLALNRLRGISIKNGREIIKKHLQDKMCRPRSEEVDCRDVIFSLESSFDYPTAMPIFLRPWSSEDIARISLGHTEVYFGFDVNAWGKHLQSSRLVWSSQRQGRKELSKAADKRFFVVRNRIPQIVGPKGKRILLGTQFLQIMLCEGISPISLAAYYDQVVTIAS